VCGSVHKQLKPDFLALETWLIYICAMTHSHVCHDSFRCVPWLIHTWDMTHAYTCHDSFMYKTPAYVCHLTCICVALLIRMHTIFVPWLIHMCDMIHSCESWLIHVRDVLKRPHLCRYDITSSHMCGIIYSHVWHDSFMCVTWLIHVCDIHRSDVLHDSFMGVTWLVHVCHDSFIYETCWSDIIFVGATWLLHICVASLIHTWDMTHLYVWHNSFM